MTREACLYFALGGAAIVVGSVAVIAGKEPHIEAVSADLETVIGAVWVVEEAWQLRAEEALAVNKQLLIAAESAMRSQLARALETSLVAGAALLLFFLEKGAALAVAEGTAVVQESVALFSVTGETLVIGGTRAGETTGETV